LITSEQRISALGLPTTTPFSCTKLLGKLLAILGGSVSEYIPVTFAPVLLRDVKDYKITQISSNETESTFT